MPASSGLIICWNNSQNSGKQECLLVYCLKKDVIKDTGNSRVKGTQGEVCPRGVGVSHPPSL